MFDSSVNFKSNVSSMCWSLQYYLNEDSYSQNALNCINMCYSLQFFLWKAMETKQGKDA